MQYPERLLRERTCADNFKQSVSSGLVPKRVKTVLLESRVPFAGKPATVRVTATLKCQIRSLSPAVLAHAQLFGESLHYLQGGVASGFHHVTPEKHQPCLLHIKVEHPRQVDCLWVASLTPGRSSCPCNIAVQPRC